MGEMIKYNAYLIKDNLYPRSICTERKTNDLDPRQICIGSSIFEKVHEG